MDYSGWEDNSSTSKYKIWLIVIAMILLVILFK